MTKYVAVGFGAGVIIGTIIGYFMGKKKTEKEFEEMLMGEESSEEDANESEKTTGEDTPKYVDYSGSKASSTDYRKFYPDPAEMMAPSEDDVEKTELDEEVEEEKELIERGYIVTDENRADIEAQEMNKEAETKKPRIITAESFDNDYPHFDKVQLEYYAENDCLVDSESNEEIFDEQRAVGDCLDKFNFRTNDEEVIFVRNFSFGTDYEISKLWSSFMTEEED